MTRFSFRGLVYVLVVLFGLLSAAPNILPQTLKQQLPSWYTSHTLSLGLDLQGGSHLLLAADTDALFKKQLDGFTNDVFSALREQNIRYSKTHSADSNAVAFTLRDSEQGRKVKEIAYTVTAQPSGSSALDVDINDANITLKLSELYTQSLLKDALNRSVDVVRKRLNETGLTEPSVTLQGSDAILVQMPGVSDPTQVKKLLGTTAQMTFHWQVNSQSGQSMTKQDDSGKVYQLEQRVALEGEHITDAAGVLSNENGQPVVTFRLDNVGAKQFATMTRDNIGRVLAIVLDDKVVTAPVINSVIPGGRGEITGNFTLPEASNVALMLRTGALPVPLSIIEERTVGPDLGSDAIQTGIESGLAGGLLVLAFMVVIYGRWGAIASLALCVNMALVFGALTLFGATLTLPGIAGLILTMGMAVDANILINERIREESKKGRPATSAIQVGFEKAFATIVDSNFTTLIAVSLLFMFGSGPIKGFAVTIAIGLVSSVFTAVALTKMLMLSVAGRKQVDMRDRTPLTFSSPLLRLSDKLKGINFLAKRRLALAISIVLTVLSIGLFAKPGLHYGVDFTGGTLIELTAPKLSTDALRDVIRSNGFEQVSIQEYGSAHHYLLRAPVSTMKSNEVATGANLSQTDQLKLAISSADANVSFDKVDMVGPKVSGGFAELSILALLIAGAGMLIYLWSRFEAHFALAALLTVVLDLTKTIGFFALTGIEFNLTAVAALLALIGYSINDKVVVLDRIRELIRLDAAKPLGEIINSAVNSTLSRTVFTSVTTLLALLPMALFGGDAVASFALPMVFAVIIGTSSTLFITSTLLYLLGKRRQKRGKAQLKPTSEEIKASLAHIP
ncbi:protein translocase subunit SecDF [Alteromonas sp. KUL42]|uniref:protein translocase subunit SecD n=1 Tax=Alteromonas sp. KUL42 TaxID=2480797 RepID=UPI0010361007|nr:protein translocase subunit SecD [Alteromonas sp. KUL42]TAP31430.1 protein translocase subunit SecD [Alteromonas sp. KUL42]GEA09434.1 protein translocase subunit SecDF [Alteromonas sp. KUL42]